MQPEATRKNAHAEKNNAGLSRQHNQGKMRSKNIRFHNSSGIAFSARLRGCATQQLPCKRGVHPIPPPGVSVTKTAASVSGEQSRGGSRARHSCRCHRWDGPPAVAGL